MRVLKESAWFILGAVFVVTLIPPALIIAAVAMIAGPMERE